MVARDQASMAVPEHVGHCGQREEAGGILRRAAQQSPAPLSVQREDAGRDVLWHGRRYPEEAGRSQVASSGTKAQVKPRTKLPSMFPVSERQLLSRYRLANERP